MGSAQMCTSSMRQRIAEKPDRQTWRLISTANVIRCEAFIASLALRNISNRVKLIGVAGYPLTVRERGSVDKIQETAIQIRVTVSMKEQVELRIPINVVA